VNDGARLRALERQIAVLRARRISDREALQLQAAEYQRRLSDLNHAHQRIVDIQSKSVTAEKFDDYQKSQKAALDLALKAVDEAMDRAEARIGSLEQHRSKAVGAATVLVLFAGLVGAAVMRALGG
jgi:hypothetical protein